MKQVVIILFLLVYNLIFWGQPNFLNTEPDWSPDGESIIFISKRDRNNELYLMNKDGSCQIRLTKTDASESTPSWSPDGSKILFVSNRTGVNQIFSMNKDGTKQINLTNTSTPEYNPIWSPKGDKIAFSSVRDGNTQIYIMNTDGSNQTRISPTGSNQSFPIWSSNGQKLAYLSITLKNDKINEEIIMEEFVFDFNMKISKPFFKNNEIKHFFVSWTNDMTKILYSKTKDYYAPSKIYISDSEFKKNEVFIKKVDDLIEVSFSTNEKTILYTTTYSVFVLKIGEKKAIKVGRKHHSAEWSPDGTSIVMVSGQKTMNIYTVNPDGTNLKQLTFKK